MSTNKTQETEASVAAYIAGLESKLRPVDTQTVVDMMTRLSGEPAKMWGNAIIGFGSYHYIYESGREGDSLRVGVSPRKAALSIYIMPGYTDFGEILSRLGKHKIGKSCLYIKKLSDVDTSVLEELITAGLDDLRKRYPEG